MGYYKAGGGVPWEALGGPIGAGYRIGRALADSPLGDSPLRAGAPAHTAAVARIAAAAARPQVASQLQPAGRFGDVLELGRARGGDDLDGDRPRYRRMNALNPHALRRSMRRVQAFAKFARKTISFTQRVKMKKRRK